VGPPNVAKRWGNLLLYPTLSTGLFRGLDYFSFFYFFSFFPPFFFSFLPFTSLRLFSPFSLPIRSETPMKSVGAL